MRIGSAKYPAFGLAVMVALLVMLLAPRLAHARTFTVNSAADTAPDGCTATECTLREAIHISNALSTTDTIAFNITTGSSTVKTISPRAQLPTITDTVKIDGYTQPGAVPNDTTTNANTAVLKIQLSGAAIPPGAFVSGLTLSENDAGGTKIKGLVINSFGGNGVFVRGDGAGGSVIKGNFIGTDPTGTLDLGNGGDGVRIESSDNVIGGPPEVGEDIHEPQNVISGNGGNGVFVDGETTTATGNIISNNHIGTDADAEEDLGNSGNGVHLFFAPNTEISGTAASALNILSGNGQHGVLIDNIGASGTKVLGNLIGVNRNGNGFSDIGNTRDGVRVSSAPQNEIGGTLAGQGNTISDNGEHGVEIAGSSSTFNKVLGNRIGTNANGSSDFGNADDGVRIGNASNNTIGGTSAGARNVISGNDANGVFISGTDIATFNKVEGNFIGTDASGTGALGNAEVGVRVETPGNFIGGTVTGSRNVISDNGGTGVSILATGVSNAANNQIQGNFIGTDANGTGDLGNFHGVFISDAPGNLVGGTTNAARNTISGNDHHGVIVIGASATGNRVLRNSIFENGQLGIELNNDGVSLNDPQDTDTGPNLLQNFPRLVSATTSGDSATIEARLNSTPDTTFLIQFFSNPTPNFPTGFGEGKKFIGQKNVTTDSTGRVTFTKIVQAVPAGNNVTATATDPDGNTSELSSALIMQ